MGDVLRLTGLAHTVALDGLGEYHGRLAAMLHGRRIGRVDLMRIVATAIEAPDVVVGHRRHQLKQFRVFAKEMFAHISAVLRLEGLELAIDTFVEALHQQAFGVPRKQRIPVTAPNHLDDVPAGTAEIRL